MENFLYVFKAALSGRYRRARRATFVFAAGGARPGGGLKRSPFVRPSPPRPGTLQPEHDHQDHDRADECLPPALGPAPPASTRTCLRRLRTSGPKNPEHASGGQGLRPVDPDTPGSPQPPGVSPPATHRRQPDRACPVKVVRPWGAPP